MTNRELRTIKRQRKIRNEFILLGLYDFACLVCLIGFAIVLLFLAIGSGLV
jgi:hypothetical protein